MRNHLPRCRPTPLVGLLALLLALQATIAGANGWCRADPVFELGGRVGHVYVASLDTMLDAASGPVQVVITVPKGVPVRLLSADNGFGHGYDVSFREQREWGVDRDRRDEDGDGFRKQFRVTIAVLAPTRGRAADLPVVVEFVASDGTVTVAEGTSDRWIVLRSYL